MKDPISRPTALVTGATSGIGFSFAQELARRHFDLVLVARRDDALREVGSRLEGAHGVRTVPVALDLAAADAADRLVRQSPGVASISW